MRLLMALPSHREIVSALFAYDVVGFQSRDWMDSFFHYVHDQFPEIDVDEDGTIHIGDRTVRVMVCPIGIDAEDFAKRSASGDARQAAAIMLASLQRRALIVGVDRLDYSKGLQERFLGYERFLAQHPAFHDKVSLLQIAPPSRGDVPSYQDIRQTLDGLSGHINGEFSTAYWVPLRYVNRGYGRTELAGIFRASKAALVTPLRDGMNLVAKEYVAAQDPDDPGVLILSSFAGAAAQLTEAVLVNPFSAEELAEAIELALTMPLAERVRRWQAMMANVRGEDVNWWLEKFMGALAESRTPEEAA